MNGCDDCGTYVAIGDGYECLKGIRVHCDRCFRECPDCWEDLP